MQNAIKFLFSAIYFAIFCLFNVSKVSLILRLFHCTFVTAKVLLTLFLAAKVGGSFHAGRGEF